MIELPANLTFAVIPDTQHANRLARYAHHSGKEVMVHLPMENSGNLPMSSIALTSRLTREEFSAVVDNAMSQVPFASGINNHMGSLLTQQPQAMAWLMDSVRRHQLFFVDSRTTHRTIASNIARQKNIRSASRDIFLDNERSLYEVDLQFRKLLKLAKRNRTAIGIGHPYPVTIEYLTHAIPLLEKAGVQVIPVSEMIKMRLASEQVAATNAGSGGD